MMHVNKDGFYSVRLLALCQTPKQDYHSWSSVHDFLFNIFAAKLHAWRPTPLSATREDSPCRRFHVNNNIKYLVVKILKRDLNIIF